MDVAGVISTSGRGGGALDEATVNMADVCGKGGWCGDGEEAR